MTEVNFPKIKPIVYYDVTALQPENKAVVRKSGNLRVLTYCAFALNLAAAVALIASKTEFGTLPNLIVAIILLAFYPPLEWLGVHFVLFRAALSNKSLAYVLYFSLQTCEIALKTFLAIGIKNGGSGGLLGALAMFSSGNVFAGVVCLICALVFAANVVCDVVLVRLVYVQYKRNGHSLKQARNEGISAAAKNPTIRKTVIASAV